MAAPLLEPGFAGLIVVGLIAPLLEPGFAGLIVVGLILMAPLLEPGFAASSSSDAVTRDHDRTASARRLR